MQWAAMKPLPPVTRTRDPGSTGAMVSIVLGLDIAFIFTCGRGKYLISIVGTLGGPEGRLDTRAAVG